MTDLLKKIGGYGVVAALALVLVPDWLGVVGEANQIQGEACLGLDPERVDRPAADFVLPDLSGAKRRVLAEKGKVILLHFWFTRCPPCIEELPSLAALQRTLQGSDVALVTVSVDEPGAKIGQFLNQHGAANLSVLLDPKKTVSTAYGTSKFPETYLIDRQGKVRYRFVNRRDWSSPLATACVQSLQ